MTTDHFMGYVEELPAMRAERLLDAAGAAHPTKPWIDALAGTLRSAASEATQAARGLFTVNGVRVGAAGLKRFFGQLRMPGGGTFGVERGAADG